MAIFHVRMQVIGRSSGRSVVAAAAYRAAELLHDARQGRDHDFTAKTGVVHSEIMLPEGAPERWQDRATLWNEVEAGEKRKDAQLAREMEFSIPRELSQAEAIRLAQDFVREQFVSRGMVADVNVHWATAKDGEAQPHAHVMLTMREATVDGFGPKAREWNARELYEGVRERWATLANERLAEQGHDVRIDHRSYVEQGIALEPQNKIGPAGARREARGEDAERAAEHRAIARRNGEALLLDPSIALRALTHQQSTFTRVDLARLVHRQSDGGAQFAAVMARVEASPELVRVGEDGRGRARFSMREMVDTERRMEAAGAALGGRARHQVGEAAALRAARATERGGLALGAEQTAALLHVTGGTDLALVVGYAGTGKSAMLGVARQVWEAAGLRVRGAALSGIAAEGLEGGSGIGSRTLASLEHGWREGRDALTARDVLVVDEAGMIGSRQMQRVLSAAQAAGAKVVLVGDPEQLQAIEAGAAFRALADRHGARAITAVRRQREAWQREATRELATGRTAEALARYAAAGMVQAADTREAARAALVAGWDGVRRQSPQASQVILAFTRDDVRALNDLARGRMRAAGALSGADQVVQTERGARAFAAGDRIMFGKNERGLGGGVAVKNGTRGTVLAVAAGGERLTVRLDGGAEPGNGLMVTFSTGDYAHLDHGYAATAHKAQSVTVDRAHVLATPHMDRHAAYAGLTRHRDGVALHYGREDFADPAALARVLSRERAKDTSLDYDGDGEELLRRYGERRGFDPLRPESQIVVRPEPEPQPAPAPVSEHDAAAADPATPESAEASPPKPDVPAPTLPEAPGIVPDGSRGPAPPLLPPPLFLYGGGSPRPPQRVEEPGPERLEPLVPAVPFRPVKEADVAAAVEADMTVARARSGLSYSLEQVYRDPGRAAERLAALEQELGGAAAAAQHLAGRPTLLGGLRGSRWFFAADGGADRHFALKSAGEIGPRLVAQREAERRAASAYREPIERQRHLKAIAVPDLSRRARQAVAAVRAAGAAADWTGPPPWELRPPRAEEITNAARVAPLWEAIRADAALHGELTRFMQAADRRLPRHHDQRGEGLASPERAAQQMSGILHAAEALHRCNPGFQAYAAEAPMRQAQAARAEAERQALVAREVEAARLRAEEEAKAEARRAAALAERRRFQLRPSPGPRMG